MHWLVSTLLVSTGLGFSVVAVSPTQESADAQQIHPTMAWGDFDSDGAADVLCVYALGETRLFKNMRDGNFIDVTDVAGLPLIGGTRAALWVDYDGDGNLDIHLERLSE